MVSKKVLLWLFLGCIAIAMLVGIAAILLPSRFVSDEVMATIMLSGVYSFGGMIMVVISRKMKRTTRVGAIGFGISFLVFVTMIWFDRSISGDREDLVYKIGFISLVVGFVAAHRLLIVPLRMVNTIGVVCKIGALVTAGLTGAMLILLLLTLGFWDWGSLHSKLIWVGMLLSAGTSIAAGAIAMFGPKPGDDEPGLLSGSIEVSLVCPRCSNQISAKSNQESRCEHCRLKVRVEVEEPRCRCGYLLYQLESDTCPECGRAIDPNDRWDAETKLNP
tara:strand:- start:262 stop:1089 length:828 start_codon:yes stop_codon:yes gene_type:complete